MRVDRYLFFIRLAKSRTLAQAIIDEGHVRIDGRRVGKASDEVRVGSVVALPLHGQVPDPQGALPARTTRPRGRGAAVLRRAGN